eukprot:Nk52_evm31s229 gene=Nk52_evmTU31s229
MGEEVGGCKEVVDLGEESMDEEEEEGSEIMSVDNEEEEEGESGGKEFIIKWGGKEYRFMAALDDNIGSLKEWMYAQTGVRPEKQKILGMKIGGKMIACKQTSLMLCDVEVKTKRLMMTGTAEEVLSKHIAHEEDCARSRESFPQEASKKVSAKDLILEKVYKRVSNYSMKILNEPREGKKLLVLDVDYTLYDHRSSSENLEILKRPFLLNFLSSVYPYFDIAIWSATSYFWVEEKMKRFGVLDEGNDFKIVTILDSRAMISVCKPDGSLTETKNLDTLWGLFAMAYPRQGLKESVRFDPGNRHNLYNRRNTLLVDDISRNFMTNPHNGIKMPPYKKSTLPTAKPDRELLYLRKYLIEHVSPVADVRKLRHSHWRKKVIPSLDDKTESNKPAE